MSETCAMPERIIDAHDHIDAEGLAGRLTEMDEAGVELALMMGTCTRFNDEVMRCVAQHPDRLIGGAYVDPRHTNRALEELKRWHGEGLRVVKLFPNLGYFPDDDVYRPFFEAIAERKMAVLSHCGWLAPKAGVTAAYYSHPGRFEKVIRRHSETIFILAHMGGIAGFLEAIMLTTRTPNSYVDTAPGQGTWVLECAGAMAASVPPDRLLWGADGVGLSELIERHRKALVQLGHGPHLQKIFHDNARGIFESIGAIPRT